MPRKGEFERLAYESSLRALERQEGSLNELRARAGTLLAASSMASFLGGTPLRQSEFDVAALGALGAFVVSVVGTLVVLAPRGGLSFVVSGRVLYKRLFELHDDLPELHRRLAYWLDDAHAKNQEVIESLQRAYWAAIGWVVADVVRWTWHLGRH